MKKILYLFSLLLLTFCKAQTPIIDLYGDQSYGAINNAYYKDVNGFLDQYVGTWLFTNGNTSLKLTFQKREQKFMQGTISYYEDMLVGEYQYIENGVEKVNTLNQIDTDYGSSSLDMRQHYISEVSCIKFPTNKPKCIECATNERRLRMSLSDPNFSNINGLANSFVLRKFNDGNVIKLKVWFYFESQVQPRDENENPVNFTSFSLPFGEYTLIKQ